MKLAKIEYSPLVHAYYRPGTTDEDALKEVVTNHAYSKRRNGFDVKPKEYWLDLGANIGAFAIYCRLHGATACCYEPVPENYEILRKNISQGFAIYNMAVTNSIEDYLTFYESKNPDNFYRNTIIPVSTYQELGKFMNRWAGELCDCYYDGIKMDIEGSEFGLIDEWLLPKTNKLVMEYHTSRDRSWENLERRLGILRSKFHHVKYPKVLDDYVAKQGDVDLRYDQLIFCWNSRDEI